MSKLLKETKIESVVRHLDSDVKQQVIIRTEQEPDEFPTIMVIVEHNGENLIMEVAAAYALVNKLTEAIEKH